MLNTYWELQLEPLLLLLLLLLTTLTKGAGMMHAVALRPSVQVLTSLRSSQQKIEAKASSL
jgi:hypothetical protein